MPGGREVTNTGTNSSGAEYRSFSDGSYTYRNSDGSRYFNTGSGHDFFKSGPDGSQASGGVPYTRHTNHNQGTSSTKYKGSK